LDKRGNVVLNIILEIFTELMGTVKCLLHDRVVFGSELFENLKEGRNDELMLIKEFGNNMLR